ncbi:Glucosidase 2 subunit beta [Trichoplax sp. H2]|uniref:Glucosidase 2 subunit beta n=1 Tax=Trichoplax adhaerens TaxID=10228 RepID=B3S3S3_TRIAD|nr:hypothetical protein TRIADDRAFT_64136 [Trichoplax adhaerens]EDV22330.1 hypothetical protein TRIADDRAFT_64136 [Trichoplax adhaerens]RDD39751.1 Glucosidase 2 subunit beta [Trichoplax sp. H2]|eukprot:XP_002114874.1 hypothetical protein TRIADDRAFT_64136 [Trichoplax adhaerens]
MTAQKYLWFTLTCLFYTSLLASIGYAGSGLPKGAQPSLASNYDSSRPFRCLNGLATIDFTSVNDNYCDCSDGSDEPGTSACPNGRFYCHNVGYKPLIFPSSRVNDGICDCCDGTDEYDGKISCQNTCDEVGAKYREELRKLQEEAEKGYVMRLQYAKEGLEAKEKYKAKLQSLKADIETVRQKASELEAKKSEAEKSEKERLDAFEKEWEETKAKKREEYYNSKSKSTFDELDSNKDGSITVNEIIGNLAFDADGNGEVSEEEAKQALGEAGIISSYDNFMSDVWPKFNDKLVQIKPQGLDSGERSMEQPADSHEVNIDDDIVAEDEDEAAKEHVAVAQEEDMYGQKPEHDEELKNLVAVADKARQEYKAAEDNKNNMENEIQEIEKVLGSDFGSEEEFAYLRGKCYQFTDREYTYELCPFDKVTQTSKSGGSQTSLGTWGSWVGAENKYSKMKYEGGQNCWNGPDRSATIVISCGTEDSLISASEPNRCEYLMEFKTPAACFSRGNKNSHDEL